MQKQGAGTPNLDVPERFNSPYKKYLYRIPQHLYFFIILFTPFPAL
jgi:hypothetical protein